MATKDVMIIFQMKLGTKSINNTSLCTTVQDICLKIAKKEFQKIQKKFVEHLEVINNY